MKITPRDTVDALRTMRANPWLLSKEDGTDVKEAVQGVVTMYLSEKRSGGTDLEFRDWYETADVTELAVMDEVAEPDPTE